MNKVESIWIYDPNQRFYVDDEGKKHTAPIYSKSWHEYKVISETKQSWIMGTGNRARKVPKNPEKRKYAGTFAFSNTELEEMIWVEENKRRIINKVEKLYRYATLSAIDDLITNTESELYGESK